MAHMYRIVLNTALLVLCLAPWQAKSAGNWGLSIAYNNPVYSDLGGNLIYFGKNWAFEVGIGHLSAHGKESNEGFSLSGGTNLKLLFGQIWRPFLEAGVGFGFGGSGSGAHVDFGSTKFAGGGLLYLGSTVFSYLNARYVFESSGKIQFGVGVGVRF